MNAPIKEANEQNVVEWTLSEEVSKIPRTGAARDHFGAIAQFEAEPTIDWFARDYVIEVDDGRAVYATKVLRVEPLLELIQSDLDQI